MNSSTRQLGKANELSALQILQFTYAVLHSLTYRKRYFEFLRSDFPRIPLLVSNLDLFLVLGQLGGELMALHLMESPKLSKYVTKRVGGGSRLHVEKVSYTDETVWVDKARTGGFSRGRRRGMEFPYRWLPSLPQVAQGS